MITYCNLMARSWRKAKTLLQSSVMVFNVLAAAYFLLNWLPLLCVLGIDGDDDIVVVVLVCLTVGICLLCPLHDIAGKNLQELARVRLLVEDRGLREKWQQGGSVAWSPVPLLLRAREFSGSGAKEDFRDWETDLVAVRGKNIINIEDNNSR